jgi:hypothetical protein
MSSLLLFVGDDHVPGRADTTAMGQLFRGRFLSSHIRPDRSPHDPSPEAAIKGRRVSGRTPHGSVPQQVRPLIVAINIFAVPQVRCELDTQIGVPSWGNVQ